MKINNVSKIYFINKFNVNFIFLQLQITLRHKKIILIRVCTIKLKLIIFNQTSQKFRARKNKIFRKSQILTKNKKIIKVRIK